MWKKAGTLACFIALIVPVFVFSARFAPGAWYAELIKPGWNPPPWVFAPVWSVLYLAMAAAAALVWDSGHPRRLAASGWWLAQLVLNGLWSWLFFGLHRPGWALGELAVLVVVVAACIGKFFAIRPLAGALLVPYLAWLGFAWALNFTIWRLNGGGLATIFG